MIWCWTAVVIYHVRLWVSAARAVHMLQSSMGTVSRTPLEPYMALRSSVCPRSDSVTKHASPVHISHRHLTMLQLAALHAAVLSQPGIQDLLPRHSPHKRLAPFPTPWSWLASHQHLYSQMRTSGHLQPYNNRQPHQVSIHTCGWLVHRLPVLNACRLILHILFIYRSVAAIQQLTLQVACCLPRRCLTMWQPAAQ